MARPRLLDHTSSFRFTNFRNIQSVRINFQQGKHNSKKATKSFKFQGNYIYLKSSYSHQNIWKKCVKFKKKKMELWFRFDPHTHKFCDELNIMKQDLYRSNVSVVSSIVYTSMQQELNPGWNILWLCARHKFCVFTIYCVLMWK